jgi:hypothetical protein
MKVIIAGSRDIRSYSTVYSAFTESGFATTCTEIVSGGAKGVDAVGEEIAESSDIPVRIFPADWNAHGRAAGPIRNAEMAAYADALVAVWDGKSRGTKDMIQKAFREDLYIFVRKTNGQPDLRSWGGIIAGEIFFPAH